MDDLGGELTIFGNTHISNAKKTTRGMNNYPVMSGLEKAIIRIPVNQHVY